MNFVVFPVFQYSTTVLQIGILAWYYSEINVHTNMKQSAEESIFLYTSPLHLIESESRKLSASFLHFLTAPKQFLLNFQRLLFHY